MGVLDLDAQDPGDRAQAGGRRAASHIDHKGETSKRREIAGGRGGGDEARAGVHDGAGDVAVAVLAFHMEYWDYRGWKDPFRSSQWSVRQGICGVAQD